MLEESIENFMLQWKPYATSVQLFSHVEGSPLLECKVADTILQVFERTGPYESLPGKAQLIIHPVTEKLELMSAGQKKLEVIGTSRLRACGLVLVIENNMLVLDAGVPLVVGVFGGVPDEVALGDWLEFESLAPVHGFVVPPVRRSVASSASSDSI